MILPLYLGVSAALAPLLHWREARRMARAGVAPKRRGERFGRATALRPDGLLVWINAVSVGETLSVMRVIEALAAQGVPVLLTTTTATAADLAARRLPEGAQHQFAPLDTPAATRRFLQYWQPDLAISVESEIWPRQIRTMARSGVPQVLLNARVSDRSLKKWQRIPRAAGRVFASFTRIYAQTSHVAEGLGELSGAPERIRITGDLKASARPLPVDHAALEQLEGAIGQRKRWAAVSTHPGEEEIALAAHKCLLRDDPKALLILAPRHPERGADLANALSAGSWNFAQRSRGGGISPETQVYLADTLGELGLWFSLARGALIGASLTDRGGHNPFEAMPFGLPVIAGPYRSNFAAAYAEMHAAGAAMLLPEASPPPLAAALSALWDENEQSRMSAAARQFPLGDADLPLRIAQDVLALMEGETT